MTEKQVLDEILRYLDDNAYNYAILIDGDWGCGKTYFIQHSCGEAIRGFEARKGTNRETKYISLYGCKSIKDIQENIVWSVADDIKKLKDSEEHTTIKKNNFLLSSRKIFQVALERFLPEANPYDIISDWLTLSSYIFVFDDIERCACSLNEVFGFINGLVEHEGVKVILVANEHEISVREESEHKEWQYVVASDDSISWPKPENKNRWSRDDGRRITKDIQELERRRNLIFPEDEVDGEYRKIREKLIGVTLHYSPDIKSVMTGIVINGEHEDQLKQAILKNIDEYVLVTRMYDHPNIRTFQFFISKAASLYTHLLAMDIKEEILPQVVNFVLGDCFHWAIEFKGDFAPPTDRIERIAYDIRKKLKSVKRYVEEGDFQEAVFQREINQYIEEEILNKLAENDPYTLLHNNYWLNTQKWCEEKIEEMLGNLRDNRYPLNAYSPIIQQLVSLIEIGFTTEYLDKAKSLMANNIAEMDSVELLSTNMFIIDDPVLRERIVQELNEINLLIAKKDDQLQVLSLSEIIAGDSWVDRLDEYTTIEGSVFPKDIDVLDRVSTEFWIDRILSSNPAEIHKFRMWLRRLYIETSRKQALLDMESLKVIGEHIDFNAEDDLIKKLQLQYLKKLIEEILEKNGFLNEKETICME